LLDFLRSLIAVLVASWVFASGPAAAEAAPGASSPLTRAAVVVDGRALFTVAGIPSYPASRRAAEIAERINATASDPNFEVDQLRLEEQDDGVAIFAGSQRLVVVLDVDAELQGTDRRLVAWAFADNIRQAVTAHRAERTPGHLLRSALYTLAGAAILVAVLWLTHRLTGRMSSFAETRLRRRLQGLESLSFGVIDADQFSSVIRRAIHAAWVLVCIVATSAFLDLALEAFPWTRRAARWLVELLVDPLRVMGNAFIDSIPNLAFLAILFLVVRYLLEALRLFFLGIASGAVKSSSFEPEWAMMTFKLIRWGAIAFAIVVAYPYIPGSSSDAFKGVSVFAGILFSLGASSIVSNTLAGYTLIFRRVFKIGDRVMIGKYLGDVMEIRQQLTVVRTSKNEEVFVPNSSILASEVVNYSALARQGKLILHTSVTIGYDTPWRQVEAMLLEAAARTPGLLKEPAPFVLKNSLDDFYVSYEINVYCDNASRMAALYSSLHGNIVDAFNEHGVQIMSPHFVAQPEQVVLVPKDKWFEPPARPPAEDAGAHSKA
jgi:small-conductance mechanosensitive channel